MKFTKTPAYFELLMAKSCDANLVDMWLATHYDADDNDMANSISFDERREIFFWLLEGALESGQLRLMNKGEYLMGTSKELVQRFRDAFPKSSFPFPDDPELDVSYWFYGIGKQEVPAIAVWRYEHPDGRVEWTPCP